MKRSRRLRILRALLFTIPLCFLVFFTSGILGLAIAAAVSLSYSFYPELTRQIKKWILSREIRKCH